MCSVMHPQLLPILPAPPARRRSDRVSISFPVEIAAIDAKGEGFTEATKTTTVSRYGCCVALSRRLDPNQKLQLRRTDTNASAEAHLVGAMSAPGEPLLYGLSVNDVCDNLWGIRFSSCDERLLDSLSDGVYFVNREREITFWSEGAEKVAGFTASEAVGKYCYNNLLRHVDDHGRPLCTDGCPLSRVMLDGEPHEVNVYLHHREGHRVPVSVRAQPVRNSAGQIVGAIEVFTSTASDFPAPEMPDKAPLSPNHDPATGLPNRRYLKLKISQAIEERQHLGKLWGLLLLSVDGFDRISDTHGPQTRDRLLATMSLTLIQCLKLPKLVGRWADDQFLALVPDGNAAALAEAAERCRALIACSGVRAHSSHVSATVSVGTTMLSPSDTPRSAMERAEDLLNTSMRAGGDCITAG